MPDPRPYRSANSHDYPPAVPDSDPVSRGVRLGRALRGTTELAREIASTARNGITLQSSRGEDSLRLRSARLEHDRLSHSTGRRRPRPEDAEDTTDENPDNEGRRRRSKRRKIEDSAPAVKAATRYGYYGQVEPGRLQMELISCDGGEHVDSRHPHMYLGAKNLLKHDKSVYCSASPSSTIVLKHADDTPFCLEKLHIVGPDNGFTAPVRHGIVYVAMDLNSLTKYIDPPTHARLSPSNPAVRAARRRQVTLPNSPERLSLYAALHDPDINAALTQRERGAAQTALLRTQSPDFEYDPPHLEAAGAPCELPSIDQEDDLLAMQASDSSMPTTVLIDEEPGPEESSSQSVLDFRLQRHRLMRRRYEIENWDRDGRYADYAHEDSQQSARRQDLDSLPSKSAASDHSVTCARFSIHKHDHKVAIKFEPEVSGRFIMLKLSADRTNVDVQSIIAKGYGGQRFFPAREFR